MELSSYVCSLLKYIPERNADIHSRELIELSDVQNCVVEKESFSEFTARLVPFRIEVSD